MGSAGGLVPTEEAALHFVNTNKIETETFTLPQFAKFKHVFHKLDDDFFKIVSDSEEGADKMSEKIEQYYWNCLKILGNEEHKLE